MNELSQRVEGEDGARLSRSRPSRPSSCRGRGHRFSAMLAWGAAAIAWAVQGADPVPVTQVPGPVGALHVDDGGSGGLPVVFVHSFAGSSADWTAQLAHLRLTRRAVALDLRAHGQSESPVRDDYNIPSLAEDVAAVVDELDLKRFVLVGHGLGGAVATAYAGSHGNRVAGLLLVGAPGKVPIERTRELMRLLDADYETVMGNYLNKLLTNARPEVAARIQSSLARMPQAPSLSLIRAVLEYDPGPALRCYRGPKLAVITPRSDDDLHRLAPEVPRQLVTGTSHWVHMDKPDDFNQILDHFLAELPEEITGQTAELKR